MARSFSSSLLINAQLILLAGVLVVKSLELREHPEKNNKLKVGQNASLACRSSQTSEVECQWSRDGQHVVIGRGEWKSIYDWKRSALKGDCSLNLINVSLAYHDGLWQCTVTDLSKLGNTVSSTPVQVHLLVEPRDATVKVFGSGMWVGPLPIKNDKVTVQEGTNITANCSVCCGSPNATLTWKKETPERKSSLNSVQRNVKQSNHTWMSEAILDLIITRKFNRVTLICFAHHDTFREQYHRQRRQFVLDVLYPPLNVPIPRNLTGYLQESVTLECPLDGNPTPKYQWFFQGENSTWKSLSEDSRSLTVESANVNHTGLYNCSATNTIFSRKHEAYGLIYLSLVEGGAFRALKSTEAIILGGALGVILLALIIGIILWIKKRRSVHDGHGRTYVSANDKDSTPEGTMDPAGVTGADGETQLNQMAWNTEAPPKEEGNVSATQPSSGELIYAELSLMNATNGHCIRPANGDNLQTIYAQLKF